MSARTSTVLDVLSSIIKKEKEIKEIRKEEIKLPIFADYVIIYVGNSKDSTKKKTSSNKWVKWVQQGNNIAAKYSEINFYILAINTWILKFRRQNHFNCSQNELLQCNSNKTCTKFVCIKW